ncbi:MAG: hypothetical protein VX438_06250, partial [Planctomycetota bacterium]|nr:hypothetical protein [Planctomycetota bacterium]
MDLSNVLRLLESRVPRKLSICDQSEKRESPGCGILAEPTALFLNHLDKEIQKFSLDPEDETLVRLWLLLAQLKRLGSGQILHEALDKCTDPQSPDFQDCVRRNVDFINEEAWSLKADAIQHAFVLPDVVVELEEAITVETD